MAVLSTASSFSAEPDFVSLFNGRDLSGWDGDTNIWSVKNGAITAAMFLREFADKTLENGQVQRVLRYREVDRLHAARESYRAVIYDALSAAKTAAFSVADDSPFQQCGAQPAERRISCASPNPTLPGD